MTDDRRAARVAQAEAEMAAGRQLVPFHLQEGLERYVLQGVPVGQFLTAVLDNDLREAVSRADPDSMAGLKTLMQFLYGFTPAGCWGSARNRKAWQAGGGVAGGAADH